MQGDEVLHIESFAPPGRAFLEHAFCLAQDSLELPRVREIAGYYGIHSGHEVEGLLAEIGLVVDGDVVDASEKNLRKLEAVRSLGVRLAVVNGREDASNTLVRYREEAGELGIVLDEYQLDDLTIEDGKLAGFEGDPADYHGFMITSPETFSSDSAPVLRLRQEVLRQLAALGPVIPSPESDFEARDKIRTSVLFAERGIPHPRTTATSSVSRALAFVEQCHERGVPAVVKPVGKGGGWGVTWIQPSTPKSRIQDLLGKYLWWYGAGVVVLQEYVPNDGYDKRVLVVDGHILGAMRRRSGDDSKSWVYNISKGATGAPCSLSDDEVELALSAFGSTGQVVSGVDLIRSKEGRTYVLETNSCPGFGGFEEYLNENVAHFILAYFSLFKLKKS
ncbi:MAG: ATP-grasp domain-containing protein [Promethearchaeota archaeon]